MKLLTNFVACPLDIKWGYDEDYRENVIFLVKSVGFSKTVSFDDFLSVIVHQGDALSVTCSEGIHNI